MTEEIKKRGRPVGSTRKRKAQLTIDQSEAIAETAFIAGEYFIEGLFYALRRMASKIEKVKKNDSSQTTVE